LVRHGNFTLQDGKAKFSIVGSLTFVEFVRSVVDRDVIQPGMPRQLPQFQQEQSFH